MASKLSVFAALFVCFLVSADASFRVTTTVMEDEENPSRQCQQQLQRQRLQSCHSYIQRQQRSGRNDDEWDILEANPQSQQSLQECCNELRQVDRECRCDALQEMQRQVQQYQQGGRRTGREQGSQQRVQQQIRRIPQMCSLQVPQRCQQGY